MIKTATGAKFAAFFRPRHKIRIVCKRHHSMNRQTLQIGALANCRKGQSVQPTKAQTNAIIFQQQTAVIVEEQEWVIVADEEKASEAEEEEAAPTVKQASSKKEMKKRTQDEL